MFITQLDVVNECLRTMGETKLNTLEDDHPYKDDALSGLDKITNDLLDMGMWFNNEWLRLVPQADTEFILVPHDVMNVNAFARCGTPVAMRGRRLYDVRRNQYEFSRAVEVFATRKLDWDLLPHRAQRFIREETVLQFQSDFDGDNGKYQKLAMTRQQAWIDLKSEDIRQKRANLLHTAAIGALRQRNRNYTHQVWHPHRTYPG